MEEEKVNCIKILKISPHAEKQNEVGKRGKGGGVKIWGGQPDF